MICHHYQYFSWRAAGGARARARGSCPLPPLAPPCSHVRHRRR